MASCLYVCVTCYEGSDVTVVVEGDNQCSVERKGRCFSIVSHHATMKETRLRIRVVVSTKRPKTSVLKSSSSNFVLRITSLF